MTLIPFLNIPPNPFHDPCYIMYLGSVRKTILHSCASVTMKSWSKQQAQAEVRIFQGVSFLSKKRAAILCWHKLLSAGGERDFETGFLSVALKPILKLAL